MVHNPVVAGSSPAGATSQCVSRRSSMAEHRKASDSTTSSIILKRQIPTACWSPWQTQQGNLWPRERRVGSNPTSILVLWRNHNASDKHFVGMISFSIHTRHPRLPVRSTWLTTEWSSGFKPRPVRLGGNVDGFSGHDFVERCDSLIQPQRGCRSKPRVSADQSTTNPIGVFAATVKHRDEASTIVVTANDAFEDPVGVYTGLDVTGSQGGASRLRRCADPGL